MTSDEIRNIGRILRNHDLDAFCNLIHEQNTSIEPFLQLIRDNDWIELFFQWFLENRMGFVFPDIILDNEGIDAIVASYLADRLAENEEYLLAHTVYAAFQDSTKSQRKAENCKEKWQQQHPETEFEDNAFDSTYEQNLANIAEEHYESLNRSNWQNVAWAILDKENARKLLTNIAKKDNSDFSPKQNRAFHALWLSTVLESEIPETNDNDKRETLEQWPRKNAHFYSEIIQTAATDFLKCLDNNKNLGKYYAYLGWLANFVLDDFNAAATLLKAYPLDENENNPFDALWKKDTLWITELCADIQPNTRAMLLAWMQTRLFTLDAPQAETLSLLGDYYALELDDWLDVQRAGERYLKEYKNSEHKPIIKAVSAVLAEQFHDALNILQNLDEANSTNAIQKELRMICWEGLGQWTKLEQEIDTRTKCGWNGEFTLAAYGLLYGADDKARWEAWKCLNCENNKKIKAISLVDTQRCLSALSEIVAMMNSANRTNDATEIDKFLQNQLLLWQRSSNTNADAQRIASTLSLAENTKPKNLAPIKSNTHTAFWFILIAVTALIAFWILKG